MLLLRQLLLLLLLLLQGRHVMMVRGKTDWAKSSRFDVTVTVTFVAIAVVVVILVLVFGGVPKLQLENMCRQDLILLG